MWHAATKIIFFSNLLDNVTSLNDAFFGIILPLHAKILKNIQALYKSFRLSLDPALIFMGISSFIEFISLALLCFQTALPVSSQAAETQL